MILDTNQWGNFLKSTEDMKPVHKWLNTKTKGGKLVFSNHEPMEKELRKHREMQKYLFTMHGAGRAKRVPEEKVAQAMKEIQQSNNRLKSNDLHLLALAEAGDVKLLCSRDKKLHQDFKNILNGQVYQDASHSHLLQKDICP